MIRTGGPNAGSDQGKIGAQFAAKLRGFAGGSDHAFTAVFESQLGQAKNLILHGTFDPDRIEVVIGKAGEDGDSQNNQIGIDGSGGLGCSAKHLRSTGSVDGQHAYAEASGFTDGGSDGVRNVVILEIEKNLPAGGGQVANRGWAFGSEQLHADFIGKSGVAHGRNKFLRCGRRPEIQGNDQSLARIVHPLQFKTKQG